MEETNALRQLPEIQNIAEYLRTMEFRKKFLGGVDAESVLEHFSAVTLQYEAIISAFMQQADAYARRLAQAEALLRGPVQQPQPQMQQPQMQPAPPQMPPQLQVQPVPPQMPQPQAPQQPCPAQNPWEQAYNPWAQPAPQEYTPWEQAYAPQAAPASPWQGGAESLPEQPSYMYA